MGVYDRIVAGEAVKVRIKNPLPGQMTEPFLVSGLLMIGTYYYTTPGSEWNKFGTLGGVVINGGKRHRMDKEEMRDWCARLEVVPPEPAADPMDDLVAELISQRGPRNTEPGC